ncbi:MAG: 50S ribosomal protein L20 [Planctomycetes bacterium]|nr:50S ribosomal protein L20 [Planctomycetota bacterium]
MRATNGAARHRSCKRIMKRAKGMRGGRHSMYRVAVEAIKRAEQQAFVGRKRKKRDFRQLWIARINIAARALGMSYSRLIAGLVKADIRMDRRMLSELSIHQPAAFADIVNKAKAAMA